MKDIAKMNRVVSTEPVKVIVFFRTKTWLRSVLDSMASEGSKARRLCHCYLDGTFSDYLEGYVDIHHVSDRNPVTARELPVRIYLETHRNILR
jgi:hypothetical protein